MSALAITNHPCRAKHQPYLSIGLKFLRDLTRAEAADMLRLSRRCQRSIRPVRLCGGAMHAFGPLTLHTKP